MTLRWRVDRSNFPPNYSVDFRPDPLILNVWQAQRKYVQFIAHDVWTVIPELYRIVTTEEMPP